MECNFASDSGGQGPSSSSRSWWRCRKNCLVYDSCLYLNIITYSCAMATFFIVILLQRAESFFVCIVWRVYSFNNSETNRSFTEEMLRLMVNKLLNNDIYFPKFSGLDCISLFQIRLRAHKAVHYQPLQVQKKIMSLRLDSLHVSILAFKSPVGGKFIPEYTDFRIWMNCMQTLSF